MFKELRTDTPDGEHTLFVAGGYEFLPIEPQYKSSPELARALAKAYMSLDYDVAYCIPEELKWLHQADADLQAPWREADTSARQAIVEAGGEQIGIIYLPMLARGATTVPSATVRSIQKRVDKLRARTRLVIGLSPWGSAVEDKFLGENPALFDILLGSGAGPGLLGRASKTGKTYWARAYTRGQAFHVITIKQWPERTPGWKWTKDISLTAELRKLDTAVADDSAMRALLGEFTLPAHQ